MKNYYLHIVDEQADHTEANVSGLLDWLNKDYSIIEVFKSGERSYWLLRAPIIEVVPSKKQDDLQDIEDVDFEKLVPKSDCHNAPVKTHYADEGTNYYYCSKCDKPCNIKAKK